MKKIILICFLFLMAQSLVFADEIIDAKGVVIPCKIITVADDFVEYKKDGNLYSFSRPDESLVFNDYIDVRDNLFKRNSIKRYFGKVIIKDLENVRLRTENGDMEIPWYRVKFVGVFKP
jgi:hypothetical protein